MPHEHCNTEQGAATLLPCQFPVYPSDPEGVLKADLDRLPADGKVVLVPDPPNSARLQPFRELLGFSHVALHVACCLFPLLHGFHTSTGVEMPLGDLPGYLIPGRRYKAA